MDNSDILKKNMAILGGGNIAQALVKGLISTGLIKPAQISITRRNISRLNEFKKEGCYITKDNAEAVKRSEIIILAVWPNQLPGLIKEIKDLIISPKHLVISLVTAISIEKINKMLKNKVPVIRVVPNIAVAVKESMTCLAGGNNNSTDIERVTRLFDTLGKTVVLKEEDMTSATILCACGIAYFLRVIRAASQGGIEIGFHSPEAIEMAAQTAKGSAALLLSQKIHPEEAIDKVTTPRGITISGLNQMEHEGLSSAIIKGIMASNRKAEEI